MITGYATPEGTKKFAERQNQDSHENYKNVHNLHYPTLVLVHILEIQILRQTSLLKMQLKNQF